MTVTATTSSGPAARPRRRRPELAAFLRGRRARITPEEAGLPAGPRRRTPGLRREEVAQLAGIGITWYTWLEQGRPINASGQVLDAVARVLRLDEAEREHLYHLAEVPFVPRHDQLPREVGPDVRTVLSALEPLPAVVYNARYDILAHNAFYPALMFASPTYPEGVPRNATEALFTGPPESCPVVFRKEELRLMVASLRGAYGNHVGEPAWESFLRRMRARSPEFAAMWASGDVAPHGPRVKVFRHPVAGELRLRTLSLAVSGMPETRMVVYTGDDEATQARMARLREGD
ncbi:helix-turn-helix transcriptional regulator [Streptomyces sp. 7-21]|uniref:helix-turn-helix transcriptional regulator n=1 Tax=Streptomyces sp. 7-21 TaxID=2802283 RepID=UPI00191DB22B|nr:helix-turn-helix transcriptional regulator [Streptomyces sp. 7-21]MBL1067799.1 helix-turn-helix domain-containing protein [Streptomyces sp. 7-21]